ncbi:hypothetical protein Tco_1420976 [Tanacetum coccineum]
MCVLWDLRDGFAVMRIVLVNQGLAVVGRRPGRRDFALECWGWDMLGTGTSWQGHWIGCSGRGVWAFHAGVAGGGGLGMGGHQLLLGCCLCDYVGGSFLGWTLAGRRVSVGVVVGFTRGVRYGRTIRGNLILSPCKVYSYCNHGASRTTVVYVYRPDLRLRLGNPFILRAPTSQLKSMTDNQAPPYSRVESAWFCTGGSGVVVIVGEGEEVGLVGVGVRGGGWWLVVVVGGGNPNLSVAVYVLRQQSVIVCVCPRDASCRSSWVRAFGHVTISQ